MAIVAIADRCKISASLDEGRIERLRRRRLDRGNRRPPRDRKGRDRAANDERREDASDHS
jgi:hypothetical protein